MRLEIPDEKAKKFEQLALRFGTDQSDLIDQLLDAFLATYENWKSLSPNEFAITSSKHNLLGSELFQKFLSASLTSNPEVMGGDTCIRNTRIPIWSLVQYKREGLSDSEILAAFPGLNASDLAIAWDYNAAHGDVIEAQRLRHEEAA